MIHVWIFGDQHYRDMTARGAEAIGHITCWPSSPPS